MEDNDDADIHEHGKVLAAMVYNEGTYQRIDMYSYTSEVKATWTQVHPR